jgi:hypothetical protein
MQPLVVQLQSLERAILFHKNEVVSVASEKSFPIASNLFPNSSIL